MIQRGDWSAFRLVGVYFVFLGNHQCFKSDMGSYRKPVHTQYWDNLGILWEIETSYTSAFWILSRGLMPCLRRVVRSSLQYSNLEITRDWTSTWVSLVELNGQILLIVGNEGIFVLVVKDLGYWLDSCEFKYQHHQTAPVGSLSKILNCRIVFVQFNTCTLHNSLFRPS